MTQIAYFHLQTLEAVKRLKLPSVKLPTGIYKAYHICQRFLPQNSFSFTATKLHTTIASFLLILFRFTDEMYRGPHTKRYCWYSWPTHFSLLRSGSLPWDSGRQQIRIITAGQTPTSKTVSGPVRDSTLIHSLGFAGHRSALYKTTRIISSNIITRRLS